MKANQLAVERQSCKSSKELTKSIDNDGLKANQQGTEAPGRRYSDSCRYSNSPDNNQLTVNNTFSEEEEDFRSGKVVELKWL